MKIAVLVSIDPDFWRARRVLVTGHTGFKGAWLSLWLQSLGAHVSGLARETPTRPSVYALARVGEHMTQHRVDVRDAPAVARAFDACEPEVVFHLAAQPMVGRSLREPALTYEVNVMGTVNVLEAVRRAGPGVRAVVLVTSDKCYENDGAARDRFVEGDPLGGSDPYSSSKACAELVAAAYRQSLLQGEGTPRLATARAGNVIGGGDWGQDRLLADAVRAVEAGSELRLRNPAAVRPWQHVLNALSGYLLLAQALCEHEGAARAWNFGPPAGEEQTVAWVVERVAALWEGELRWATDGALTAQGAQAGAEAAWLALDSTAAEAELGWRPRWCLGRSLELLVAWHRRHRAGEDMRGVSLGQLALFAEQGHDRPRSHPLARS